MRDNPTFSETIRHFWGMLKPYRWLVCGAILSVAIIQLIRVGDSYVYKVAIDTLSTNPAAWPQIATYSLLALATFAILRAAASYSREHFLIHTESGVLTDTKRKYLAHILRLDHEFHTTHKTGSMIARITRGGRAIEQIMDLLVYSLLSFVFQIALLIVFLAALAPGAIVIVLTTIVLFLGFSLYRQIHQLPSAAAANDADDFDKGTVADIFTNIEAVKYFGKEESMITHYHAISESTAKTNMKFWGQYRFTVGMQGLLVGLGSLSIMWYVSTGVVANTITVGTAVFLITSWISLTVSLYDIASSMRRLYQARVDYISLILYDREVKHITDAPNAPKLVVNKGVIEFDHVHFGYTAQSVLQDFTLKINTNEKVALVGISGSGKSTIVKLLYRFYDVQQGAVRIDGVDLRTVQQESLRSKLAIVPQETILFDDTLWSNIAFSNPKASPAEVHRAIKLAQLESLVSRLPLKEKTIVGERGIKLSGGEKQRVAIARAILADRRILVLDEATSSLDSETEHEIQEALKVLLKGRTAIIIAHRLSTIMRADRIIVLEKGKIVQEGTHAQLVKKPGRYRSLWKLQKGGYIGG